MNEWIKCSEGENMPRINYERVLFTDGQSVYSGVYWSKKCPMGRKYLFLCCCEGNSISATHWMTLPDVPHD